MTAMADGGTGSDVPEIVDVMTAVAAVAWGRVSFAELPAYQQSARVRVDAVLAAAGIATDDAPRLTFSRAPEGGTIAIAPGMMIDSPFGPSGGVTVETIPSGRAAHLRLRGSYERLPQAWGALSAWVATQGLATADLCWEVYTDPSGPVTDLYVMLA